MSFFNLFKQSDINQGIQDFRNASDALLLDVRSPQEYREGHIPGSENIPLQVIDKLPSVVENRDKELFVYCYSGARSREAVKVLRQLGYSQVHNIGGIAAYSGKVER